MISTCYNHITNAFKEVFIESDKSAPLKMKINITVAFYSIPKLVFSPNLCAYCKDEATAEIYYSENNRLKKED